MLREYAILPKVFNNAAYPSDALAEERIADLAILLEEAIVRGIPDKDVWSAAVSREASSNPHPNLVVSKLLKQIALRSPLRRHNEAISASLDEHGWLELALRSHRYEPLDGIVTPPEKHKAAAGAPVQSVHDFVRGEQGKRRSCILPYSSHAFAKRLKLLLKHANFVKFIDPYLAQPDDYDPASPRFPAEILLQCRFVNPLQTVELHRRAHIKRHRIWTEGKWREHLEPWHQKLCLSKRQIRVVFWNDPRFEMHRRYLISDLLGISMDNGLFGHDKPDQKAQWTLLNRDDREQVSGDYDADRRAPLFQFCLGDDQVSK